MSCIRVQPLHNLQHLPIQLAKAALQIGRHLQIGIGREKIQLSQSNPKLYSVAQKKQVGTVSPEHPNAIDVIKGKASGERQQTQQESKDAMRGISSPGSEGTLVTVKGVNQQLSRYNYSYFLD
jgi:hypothetical protein